MLSPNLEKTLREAYQLATNNKHEYVEGCFLNNNEIHYDMKNGFINIKKTILHRSIKLKKPCFCIACRK